MNIVLIHIGGPVPPYFWICVNQIRKHYDGPLYVYADSLDRESCEEFEVDHILGNHLDLKRVQEFEKVSFLRDYGQFWDFTFRRLFVLEAIIRVFSLSNVIHIENDVMIYTDPRTLGFTDSGPVSANDIGPKYATYAYTHIPNFDAIHRLNDANIRVLKQGKQFLNHRYGEGMVNEMLIAKDLMNQGELAALPVLLFDGASAGQYLFGTHQKDPPGWTGAHHHIGKMIRDGEIKIEFSDTERCPYVTLLKTGTRHKMHNLHIHSKRLDLAT